MFNFLRPKLYTLNHSKKTLRWGYHWFKKKANRLSAGDQQTLERNLRELDQAILNKDRAQSDQLARQLESFGEARMPKNLWDYTKEILSALFVAFIIAVLVRQMWFELYEIPTGSMRPTFKEQDHLTVSKTAFGINYPLKTDHLYFDPHLVNRNGIVIWSGDGIDLPDIDTTYFGFLPYKKRFVKRLIGKPGDSLYFYGGKIYGVDQAGKPIQELLDTPSLEQIEHIPFISFEGDIKASQGQILFKQMNLPLGRLTFLPSGKTKGEVYNGEKWIKENLSSYRPEKIEKYSDFMGIGNFAKARLLTKKELERFDNFGIKDLEEGVLYLQLSHHPNLTSPAPSFPIEGGGRNVMLTPLTTIIPLQQHHLDAIMKNMYTARFIIKDGLGQRYSVNSRSFTRDSPSFSDIPDGRYEFYYGKAYQIGWGAIAYELPSDHPLYKASAQNVQRLFNLGIDMNKLYEPKQPLQFFSPHRYAYFRDGDLYLMGGPIVKKDDLTLKKYLDRESKREAVSTSEKPYLGFKDRGAPLHENELDISLIQNLGVKVPEKHYLVLGDNHAMSADSRVFGFVPQENLEGVPSLIIWPPGDRLGAPLQKPYQIFVLPRLIIWSIVAFLLALWYLIHRYRMNQSVFAKDDRLAKNTRSHV